VLPLLLLLCRAVLGLPWTGLSSLTPWLLLLLLLLPDTTAVDAGCVGRVPVLVAVGLAAALHLLVIQFFDAAAARWGDLLQQAAGRRYAAHLTRAAAAAAAGVACSLS